MDTLPKVNNDLKAFLLLQQLKLKPGKRMPQSTPSSPSKGGGGAVAGGGGALGASVGALGAVGPPREPRCTCAMTLEQMQRARSGRARYAASAAAGSASTLPRSQSRPGELGYAGKLSAHPSSQSVYDNVSTSLGRQTPIPNAVKQTRSDVNLTTIGERAIAIEGSSG